MGELQLRHMPGDVHSGHRHRPEGMCVPICNRLAAWKRHFTLWSGLWRGVEWGRAAGGFRVS